LEQLQQCTVRRAHYLGALTIGAVFVLYNVLGLGTYFDKRDQLLEEKSLLEYYDPTHPFTIIATSGMVVIMIVSCPVHLWALRNSVNDFFFKGTEMTPLRWVTIGGTCSLLGAFLSSTSDSITLFFDIVGGMTCPTLILLMPVLFYMKCRPDASPLMKYLAWQHVAFMVIGVVTSLYQVINNIVHGKV
jgi:ABC-type multidrug transport system fused ATPase/permease subunit